MFSIFKIHFWLFYGDLVTKMDNGNKYFSNSVGNVFVVQNLPEVVKGALFSKYSRSYLGLRELFEKEFVGIEENSEGFYDRILDGYGDDSIAELGGAHLAFEGVSMLAAKTIEDCRIGGSPLEKSTRYIYFDRKDADGDWQYYRDRSLMKSCFAFGYVGLCDRLFETYSSMVGRLRPLVESLMPREESVSKTAYAASVRAKTLDLLRGLLPAAAKTNLGIFGNGRFFSGLLSKLDASPMAEMNDLSATAFGELNKVIPAFIKRSHPEHKNQMDLVKFLDSVTDLKKSLKVKSQTMSEGVGNVKLVSYDPFAPLNVATMMLFEESNASISEIESALDGVDLDKLFERMMEGRTNRRHKGCRALENAYFTFEIVGDFGAYRDLHRHRTLTQERQRLTCDLGYFIPEEIIGTEFEAEYRSCMNDAKKFYDKIAPHFPDEAQYVVPMAYNVRWYFKLNLRALQWICELRSQPAGHENYREVAQKMARAVCDAFPEFRHFFKYADYDKYQLGRLGQEIRKEGK